MSILPKSGEEDKDEASHLETDPHPDATRYKLPFPSSPRSSYSRTPLQEISWWAVSALKSEELEGIWKEEGAAFPGAHSRWGWRNMNTILQTPMFCEHSHNLKINLHNTYPMLALRSFFGMLSDRLQKNTALHKTAL